MKNHNINYVENKIVKTYKLGCYVFCCVVFSFIFSTFSFSQSFKNYVDRYKNAELEKINLMEQSFKISKKNHFTAYLPSASYDMLNKQFRVTYSLTHLASLLKQSKKNKIELAKLQQATMSDLFTRINRFEDRYSNIQDSYTALKSDLDILKIDSEIFNLKQQQYKNNKINYEKYLDAKRSYLSNKQRIANKSNSILTKIKMLLSDLGVPNDEIKKFWLCRELSKIFSSVRRDWKPVKSEV